MELNNTNNWIYAGVIFAPVMALGAWFIYVAANAIWKETVGQAATELMRKSCVEGLALGVYGLVVAVILQSLFGRNVMATYMVITTMLMGVLAGGWSGQRWRWFWRCAGFVAVFLAGIYSSLIG
ncbi:MAG: hypothetical protein ACK4F8_11600 [Aquabacterium sp.]